MTLFPRRRGVTVVTEHGRALTFGVSRDRTKEFLKTMAQGKSTEVMTAMQARKVALLRNQGPKFHGDAG
jgi:hypothetical protein